MKTLRVSIATLVVLAAAAVCSMADPVDPATVGLTPRSVTFYVNTNYNNGSIDAEGVDINSQTNVVIGWEDDIPGADPDGDLDMRHWGAAWVLYDADGNLLSTEETITNGVALITNLPSSILTTYRSFFRDNGTPTAARHGWGPKIKANKFGDGFGMGMVSYSITNNPFYATNVNSPYPNLEGEAGPGWEVASLFNINDGLNDLGSEGFHPVQLMNNDMTPLGVRSGASDANADSLGAIRIADFDYLANSNIVIVGESRQAADRAMTGQTSGNVPVYRVLDASGAEVKAYTNVTSASSGGNIWHGVGVTSNGFAIRWADSVAFRTKFRLFDNNGNPTSADVDMWDLTGIVNTFPGVRGDETGFHGNGTDAYAYVYADTFFDAANPYVVVLNANGSLRWARRVADQGQSIGADRVDCAIAPDGRVLVIFDAVNQYTAGTTFRTTLGRLFDSAGNPMGAVFYVSELENPALFGSGRRPRVAWRKDLVAVVWESLSGPLAQRTLGSRTFETAAYTAPAPVPITGFTGAPSGSDMTFSWAGGSPPFTIQKKSVIDGSWSDVVPGLSYRNGTHAGGFTGTEGYYRVKGQQP